MTTKARRTEMGGEAPKRNINEGTSARTRPLSFDEIMLKRKKKLAGDSKEKPGELSGFPEKVDAKTDHDRSKNTEKGRSKKTEDSAPKAERYNLEDKRKHDPDAKIKSSHSKSSRDKEKDEKLSHHRSRASGRLAAGSEREFEKKRPNDALEKNQHDEKVRKPRKEEKRENYSHKTEKGRSDIDSSYSNKRTSDKLRDIEYSEKNDRKKERLQAYPDERSRRRRSRSREHGEERDRRSLSVSPRGRKRPHFEPDYEESSFQSSKDKSRGKYSDADNYRSGNGAYAGNYRKHGSGLGGYSPRKRKTEAAVRTPSPTIRSPEKKTSTWDQPPAGASHSASGSMLVDIQSLSSKVHESAPSIAVTPAAAKSQVAPAVDIASLVSNASVDSIQLTQATRPMRRLYIEKLPPTTSEKAVVDSLNDFLLSSGANRIQGTKPCISCTINKDKAQALVEFLTPEDATAALSFDGRSLSASIINMRRPRDFVETTTEAPEKPVAETAVISDVVRDSPHKVFIGGISNVLSSEMFMEIASAFGLLRAYRFVFNEDLNTSFAFLEYADHSVTLKACAGLNGMKLGGHVLTAVQATPDAHLVEGEADAAPSYDVPMLAKPLLGDPTQILLLKNVFNREDLLQLPETELVETLKDIRLECARFGIVKSVNIVRYDHNLETVTEAFEQEPLSGSSKMELLSIGHDSGENEEVLHSDDIKELHNARVDAQDRDGNDEKLLVDVEKKESTDQLPVDEEIDHLDNLSKNPPTDVYKGVDVKPENLGEDPGLLSDRTTSDTEDKLVEDGNASPSAVGKVGESNGDGVCLPAEIGNLSTMTSDLAGLNNGSAGHLACDLNLFEPGGVLVEFRRPESSRVAAHILHGRSYNDRNVYVGYVPYDLYKTKFRGISCI